jgi:hypothetical protein
LFVEVYAISDCTVPPWDHRWMWLLSQYWNVLHFTVFSIWQWSLTGICTNSVYCVAMVLPFLNFSNGVFPTHLRTRIFYAVHV